MEGMKPRFLLAGLWLAGCALHLAMAEGWEKWSPREDIAPVFTVEEQGGRNGETALKVATRRGSDFGAWQKTFTNVQPGKSYQFVVWHKTQGAANEKRSAIPRLEWVDARGNMVRPPEYGLAARSEGDWKQVALVTEAPEKAAGLKVQLGFGFAPNASILWSGAALTEAREAAERRVVRAVTIYHRPRGTQSAEASLEEFCRLAKESGKHRPDVVCLPEGVTVVGTGKSYWEVSEAIPGPSTERLGRLARELHSYIVAGIYEREGPLVYNTAVLMGRDGKLAGKYRKTHLPREEWEAGITPGDEYPVFETDFGKVGLIVCWDVQFPEPSRAMARQGAEILLLPIWGGNETLAKARAIENHVFLLSSSYDMKTFIVDPVGRVMAEANESSPIAFAELALDKKYFQPWLGDMKNRTWKERRPDIPID